MRQSGGILDCRAIGRPPRSFLFSFHGRAPAVTLDIDFEDRGVMNEPVDGGERHGGVREDPAPFPERLIGGDEGGPPFVAGADEFEENRRFRVILADVGKVIKDQ